MNFSQYVSDDTLELSKTTINISKLVGFLQSHVHITKLSLMDLGIDDKGAKALATLTNLTSLNLKGNKIGAEGVEALASSNLTNLTSLDLSSENPTNLNLRSRNIDKGLEALIEALYVGKFPNLIDVQYNNISAEVKKRLFDALKFNFSFNFNIKRCATEQLK